MKAEAPAALSLCHPFLPEGDPERAGRKGMKMFIEHLCDIIPRIRLKSENFFYKLKQIRKYFSIAA